MRRFAYLTFAALALCCSIPLSAADDKLPTFTDPKEAGPDFELQGEFEGTVKTDEGDQKWGVQVIAVGNGKFNAIGYKGGLPGNGWNRGDETQTATGEAKGGVLELSGDEWKARIDKDHVTVEQGGRGVVDLPRVQRKSPTLGAQPPQGAIVLFDGSSAENFENGKIIEEKLLGATNCTSKQKLGDHTLHIEFRTPFMPTATGQARGNSGVYLQSRYELQVLDSFGLEGENNECGGIYSIAKPAVNMCLPPLAWQTYDIDFKAARYDDSGKKIANAVTTIKHNGVVIHDKLELTHGTPGRLPEGPGDQGLFLQDHGNPVAFRNIWVVKK